MRNKMILSEALGKLSSTNTEDSQPPVLPKNIQDEGFRYFLGTTIAEDLKRRDDFEKEKNIKL